MAGPVQSDDYRKARMRTTDRMAAAALLAALVVSPGAGQAQEDTARKVDAIFAQWDRKDAPGAAVAVVRKGEIVYERGFGMANLEYDIPITPSTVFHIAS